MKSARFSCLYLAHRSNTDSLAFSPPPSKLLPSLPKCPGLPPFAIGTSWRLAANTPRSLWSKFSHSRDHVDKQLNEKVTQPRIFCCNYWKNKSANILCHRYLWNLCHVGARIATVHGFVGDGCDRERLPYIHLSPSAFVAVLFVLKYWKLGKV